MFTGLIGRKVFRLVAQSRKNINWDAGRSTFTGMTEGGNSVNPYFNPAAASMKKNLDAMQDEIKTWQNNFKTKNGRKPTLEEMQKDPEIAEILKNLDNQKKSIQAAIQRFRIN
jgi:hypothetical protein